MFDRVRKAHREYLGYLGRIAQALEAYVSPGSQAPDDELRARVDELERSRALWEAEVEGILRKAEGARRTARAAEERARAMEKRVGPTEGDEDGEEDLPKEYLDLVRGRDGESGEEEGLQFMPARMVRTRQEKKAVARRFKFGG